MIQQFAREVGQQLLGIAEIGSNKLLGMDDHVLKYCEQLQGHIIAIELTDLEQIIYCHPGSWGMRLSLQAPGKSADATIRGRLIGLVNLSLQQEKLSTSMQEHIEIVGNPKVAQQFQKILSELDIDWEEQLSKFTGDVLAFRIGQGIRKTRQHVKQTMQSLTLSGREYLQEESHQMPTLPEFTKFHQGVTDTRHDVDRLAARIDVLIAQRNPTK